VAPGDVIYTYTDGITEATNSEGELFGEERLYECLNNIEETDPNIIAQKVKESIRQYTDSAPQSDDITMLAFKYKGCENDIKTFKREAKIENYKEFYSWIHKTCKEWNIPEELLNKLDMCGEEIFANISFYAYPEGSGMIEAELKKSDGNIILEFKDSGLEYNPLERPDPDINLPPEERPIGGLGIFMVKNTVNQIYYKREDDKNILTLVFKIS
jgi:sigma-B regulation protein RsbU (phosphoserine phosphatase)